jgi:hypothetical protein
MFSSTRMMYTIKQGSKTVGLSHRDKHYIIGFDNLATAKKVQYTMHPQPEITLLRGGGINIGPHLKQLGLNNTSLVLDIGGTLFIPKYKGSPSPMNDGAYHLGLDKYDEFITYPLTKSIGIVLPYDLTQEDEDEYMFKAHVIEPTFNAFMFG